MTKIITKGNFKSYHKNWRQVAISYGWSYRNSKNAMKKHGHFNGYTCEQMQLNVPIPIQELLSWLDGLKTIRNDFDSSIEGIQEVYFDIGDQDQFTVVVEVENTIIESEVATDADGFDHSVDDGEITFNSIIRIFDNRVDMIPTTEEIEKLIIEKLTL